MRLILTVTDENTPNAAEGSVRFFEDTKLVREHAIGAEHFCDALATITGDALFMAAELATAEQTRELLEEIHAGYVADQIKMPTPLHDRLLEVLTDMGGATS